jgi:hypothetical protein
MLFFSHVILYQAVNWPMLLSLTINSSLGMVSKGSSSILLMRRFKVANICSKAALFSSPEPST